MPQSNGTSSRTSHETRRRTFAGSSGSLPRKVGQTTALAMMEEETSYPSRRPEQDSRDPS
jgi:hypothetical protein